MKISKSEVEKIAHLARLEIEDDRKEKMVAQLGDILQYIDKLKDAHVDAAGMSSKGAVTDNVLR
jgi:aspartyl-tRNA(Asn)/glutamyl-tRNA(Gln) amidotransferase subunit C